MYTWCVSVSQWIVHRCDDGCILQMFLSASVSPCTYRQYVYIYIYTYTYTHIHIYIIYTYTSIDKSQDPSSQTGIHAYIHGRICAMVKARVTKNWAFFAHSTPLAWENRRTIWIRQLVCTGWERNIHNWLVVWLPFFYFPIYWVANHPNWLSYFSEGFKPPTRYIVINYTQWIVVRNSPNLSTNPTNYHSSVLSTKSPPYSHSSFFQPLCSNDQRVIHQLPPGKIPRGMAGEGKTTNWKNWFAPQFAAGGKGSGPMQLPMQNTANPHGKCHGQMGIWGAFDWE